MEIRVLGPFELAGNDGQLMDVGGHLPQALLVALALAEGRLVSADQLLGSDRILTRAGGYSLKIPAGGPGRYPVRPEHPSTGVSPAGAEGRPGSVDQPGTVG